jgi:hypothetical protein
VAKQFSNGISSCGWSIYATSQYKVLESIDHLEDSAMKKCKWWPTDTIGWMEQGERKIGILLNCAPIEFEINRLEYSEMDRMYKETGP